MAGPSETQGSGSKKWLIGCGVLFALSAVSCCCGGLMLRQLPELLAGLALQPEPLPLPAPTPDPDGGAAIATRVCAELAEDHSSFLTAAELTTLSTLTAEPSLRVMRWRAEGDRLSMDLSWGVPDGGGFVNVVAGGQLRMENGWWKTASFHEMRLGEHDLAGFLTGQPMAEQLNQNMAQQRAKDPDMAAALDSVELAYTGDGGVHFTLAPNSPIQTKICGG